jgi:hypothetical protein
MQDAKTSSVTLKARWKFPGRWWSAEQSGAPTCLPGDGRIERDGARFTVAHTLLAPDGTFLGKHRKVMPTASERLDWVAGDGSTLPVFDTPLGKLGAVIRWEITRRCCARSVFPGH